MHTASEIRWLSPGCCKVKCAAFPTKLLNLLFQILHFWPNISQRRIVAETSSPPTTTRGSPLPPGGDTDSCQAPAGQACRVQGDQGCDQIHQLQVKCLPRPPNSFLTSRCFKLSSIQAVGLPVGCSQNIDLHGGIKFYGNNPVFCLHVVHGYRLSWLDDE